MLDYQSKQELADTIQKTAELFIKEFDDVSEADRDLHIDGVDRTPREMLAYQIGWMGLIQSWDADELDGKEVVTPAPGIKWNQLGALYHSFTEECQAYTLEQLETTFNSSVNDFIDWFMSFSDDEVFQAGGRKWASSTPSNWPIWKWVHMNTVAPFKSFRSKIRKWKKLRGELNA